MPTTMATSVQVLSKRKPYLKPHVQLEPRGFLEGFFEGVPHGVPRLQELGPNATDFPASLTALWLITKGKGDNKIVDFMV